MSPKRIRCDCGRVYDPVKHEKCPDCGTPRPQLLGAEAPKPPPPSISPPAEQEHLAAPSLTKAAPVIAKRHLIAGAALVVALIAVALIVRPHSPKKGGAKVEDDKTTTPAPGASRAAEVATPAPSSSPTAVVVLPPHNETKLTPTPFAVVPTATPQAAVSQVQFDLGKAIAEAAPGATIKVPSGVYRGGFVVRQPLHLVAEAADGPGPVVIQSDAKEGLAVEAKNVSVSRMHFVTQVIGNSPAVSVAQGAELTLDGCQLNSESNLGATVAQGGVLKTVSTSFIAPKGVAIQLDPGAKGNFSRTTVKESLIGLRLVSGATAELHGCAFEKNGQGDSNGAAIDLSGERTQLTADDCHFTNNTGGINVSDSATLDLSKSSFRSNGASFRGLVGLLVVSTGGSATLTDDKFESNRSGVLVTRGGKIELEKCSFDENGFAQPRGVVAGSLPLSVGGDGSSAIVRQSTFVRSTPYGVTVMDGGEVMLEDAEISGSSEVGLLVGDRSAPGGHAEIKNSHFLGNAIGLGICAGGSASADASEFRENKDGVVVLDPRSQLRLTKSKLLKNRRQGLHAFLQATANLSDCDLQDNVQGALSGSVGKADERAAVTLENCRFGQNHVFGAGAGRDSELVLNNCTFDGSDKENLYKDRGAKVTVNAPPGESPSPSPSPDPGKSHEKRSHRHATPRPHFPNPEDVRRTLRKLLPGGG